VEEMEENCDNQVYPPHTHTQLAGILVEFLFEKNTVLTTVSYLIKGI